MPTKPLIEKYLTYLRVRLEHALALSKSVQMIPGLPQAEQAENFRAYSECYRCLAEQAPRSAARGRARRARRRMVGGGFLPVLRGGRTSLSRPGAGIAPRGRRGRSRAGR